MNTIEAIAAITLGAVMFYLAVTRRQFFWAKPYFPGTKEMPLWLGRALFIFVGLGFMIGGLKYLLLGY